MIGMLPSKRQTGSHQNGISRKQSPVKARHEPSICREYAARPNTPKLAIIPGQATKVYSQGRPSSRSRRTSSRYATDSRFKKRIVAIIAQKISQTIPTTKPTQKIVCTEPRATSRPKSRTARIPPSRKIMMRLWSLSTSASPRHFLLNSASINCFARANGCSTRNLQEFPYVASRTEMFWH